MLGDMLEEEMAASLPTAAVAMFCIMLDLLAELDERITNLDHEIARRAREDETARRLMTIPGIGPITATALTALAPAAETFAKGRDFAAWLGLTPLQRSTGGKQKLGATSKMGERTLRRLLIIGASAVVTGVAARSSQGIPAGTNAGAQAAHASGGGARQQDGAHCLGPWRRAEFIELRWRSRRKPGSASEAVGDARSVEGGMAQQSARRGWENQGMAERYPSAES